MYNNSYEEYIRSVLGYPNLEQQELYQDCNSCNMQNPYNYNFSMAGQYDFNMSQNRSSELENEYPEIYKIVYPMVQKACKNVSGNVTKDDIDKMVDELYSNIEGNEQINLNINLANKIDNSNSVKVENRNISRQNKEIQENRGGRYCNNGLCDIIRILLLRELIGRPGRPGGRPPFPPPGRPPFPPPNRPPFFREWDNSFYEY